MGSASIDIKRLFTLIQPISVYDIRLYEALHIIAEDILNISGAGAHNGLIFGTRGAPVVEVNAAYTAEMPIDGQWESWRILMKGPGSGGDTIVGAKKNGTSIFTINPTLHSGISTQTGGAANFTSVNFKKGDLITYDIIQVAPTAGDRLQLQLNWRQ